MKSIDYFYERRSLVVQDGRQFGQAVAAEKRKQTCQRPMILASSAWEAMESVTRYFDTTTDFSWQMVNYYLVYIFSYLISKSLYLKKDKHPNWLHNHSTRFRFKCSELVIFWKEVMFGQIGQLHLLSIFMQTFLRNSFFSYR